MRKVLSSLIFVSLVLAPFVVFSADLTVTKVEVIGESHKAHFILTVSGDLEKATDLVFNLTWYSESERGRQMGVVDHRKAPHEIQMTAPVVNPAARTIKFSRKFNAPGSRHGEGTLHYTIDGARKKTPIIYVRSFTVKE